MKGSEVQGSRFSVQGLKGPDSNAAIIVQTSCIEIYIFIHRRDAKIAEKSHFFFVIDSPNSLAYRKDGKRKGQFASNKRKKYWHQESK